MNKQSRHLYLDTIDSISPSTPYDTSFYLEEPDNYSGYHSIALQSIVFSNSVYPFTSRNNKLIFQEDGINLDIIATITPGVYNSTEFETELKTRLDAAGSNTYTVSYNSNTLKLSISTNGTSLKIRESSTCLYELGFSESDTLFNSTLTGDYPLRLDGSQYVKIVSSFYTENISSDNQRVMACIPLISSVGSLLYYAPEELTFHRLPEDALQNISLRLRDDKNRPFELPSNCSVQYTFILQ